MQKLRSKLQKLYALSSVFLLIIFITSQAPQAVFAAGVSDQPRQGTDPSQGSALLATNQLIIKYKDFSATAQNPAQAGVMQSLSQRAGASLNYSRAMSGGAHVLRLAQRTSLAQVKAIAAQLMTSPDVEYAEPDQIRFAIKETYQPVARPSFLTPNDPQYTNQWDMFGTWGINAPTAWDITTGSISVVVADIDTGITNHAEFAGRTVPGYDFISDPQVGNDGNARDNNPSDPGDWITSAENNSGYFAGCGVDNSSWHGTHVAGTIGATGNNGVGMAGIGWSTKILPVRVLGKCGGYDSDIIDAMKWSAGLAVTGVPANANPAKVLSLSLGGSGTCGTTYQTAINQIIAAGSVIVVAAGNENLNASTSVPGNCTGVITVAATGSTGNRASYSNFGAMIEISAPGGDGANGILSTLNTGTQGPVADSYAYYQGTSMATPHVSGVVALLFAVNPSLTPAQVLQILQSTVKTFPAGSTCNTSICGSGILNAGAAVASAAGVVATPTRTRTSTALPTMIITATRTMTSTLTRTAIPTEYPTGTMTRTPTQTLPPAATFTASPSPTVTMTGTITPTPTVTLTPGPTGTATVTSAPSQTRTPTATTVPSAASCNPAVVYLDDDGAASPYPSTITLSGLDSWTTDVNVQLFGLTHSWPDDIDVLLVGPQGQTLVLISDAGDETEVNNLNLTFDDSAAQALPDGPALASAAYRPANYEVGDSFPAPAPSASGATSLAVFNGTNPNGVWSLYIVDDTEYDDGILNSGWCLNVTASNNPPTSVPAPTVQTLNSTAAQDGWILENSEAGNTGGTLNAAAVTFQIGDDAANRQYRAVLSFDTSALPDNAIIQSGLLKIKQSGLPVGTNPFNILGSLWADIRRGPFSGNAALQLGDFGAAASSVKVGAFNKTPVGGWYTDTLNAAGLNGINKTGLTQLRLYFATDDNNNLAANLMRFVSGNSATNKPQLVITYSVP